MRPDRVFFFHFFFFFFFVVGAGGFCQVCRRAGKRQASTARGGFGLPSLPVCAKGPTWGAAMWPDIFYFMVFSKARGNGRRHTRGISFVRAVFSYIGGVCMEPFDALRHSCFQQKIGWDRRALGVQKSVVETVTPTATCSA